MVLAPVVTFDHDAAVSRRILEERLDRRHERASPGPHPDRPAPAEEGNRVGLVGEPRRIARDIVTVEAHHLEGVGRIIDAGRDERLGPFAHEPRVGTVDEKQGVVGIGLAQERVDGPRLDRRHRDRCSQPCLAKWIESCVLICSASTVAARFSASRWARTAAKRCRPRS